MLGVDHLDSFPILRGVGDPDGRKGVSLDDVEDDGGDFGDSPLPIFNDTST